jgi:NHLM bacteriocin system ABC transporter ATP-binding protein
VAHNSKLFENVLASIKAVLDKTALEHSHVKDPKQILINTCKLVADFMDIKLVIPHLKFDDTEYCLSEIAKASVIRIRRVKLKEKWWLTDDGALVAYYKGELCALLPIRNKAKYKLVSLVTGITKLVDDKVRQDIGEFAYYFYSTLKSDNRKMSSVLKFVFLKLKKDIKFIFSLQLLIAITLLSIPALTDILFDTILPSMDVRLLYQIGFIFLLVSIVVLFLSFIQAGVFLHLRFTLQAILQPAIWDRVLKLPLHFFSHYTAGDLSFRASAINLVQEYLSQSTILAMINVITAFFMLFLMFFYNIALGLVALLICIIIFWSNLYFSLVQLHHNTEAYDYLGKEMGLTFQIITGLHKFRIFNAEHKAFKLWADIFINKSKADVGVAKSVMIQTTFNTTIVAISYLSFYCISFWMRENLDIAAFIAVNSAFMMLLASLTAMTHAVDNLMHTIPLYNRSKVIIEARLEHESSRYRIEELQGSIKIKHLSFQYHELDPPIYKDLNLDIESGETVALVGQSGAGKSTLIRLLLGFETPTSGKIMYDGLSLDRLQLDSLRENIGVVMQRSELIPGTILDNIIGNNKKLTRKDAWHIAESIGAASIIQNFPMGMDTFVNDGMNTFSGGEVQRLVLARVLAQNPKIIFLDEATSELDNESQTIIRTYLKELKVTQLIIAHRLSTILHADRIYVMDHGKIVQVGTAKTLSQQPGLFQELMHRQEINF